jgi:hypothetical protein
LLADGKPNGMIATVMGNSRRTVENFIAKLVKKLDVANRNEASGRLSLGDPDKAGSWNHGARREIRALEEQVAALRRQLRRAS